jgi:NAD(P)H-quinone oxidoreductase subunit 6
MGRVDLGSAAFVACALLTLGSAGVVAFARNVIHSALALLGTLVGVAGLYVLLAGDFLAATQVLVYVGATLMLILFAVMLTARIDQVASSNAPRARGAAFAVMLVVALALLVVGQRTIWPVQPTADVPSTAKLGHALLGPYVLPFEIASMALLMALVGALVIARRAVRPGSHE